MTQFGTRYVIFAAAFLVAAAAHAQAARQLREMALKEAGARFIATNNLKATPEEIAAYARWEAQFQQQDRLAKHDADRPAPSTQVHAWWIEGYKLKKALYEKYGGRVGITKWGPDPVGATEALLRQHEKAGDLAILDAALAREFWDSLAREPRFPATGPEQMDFTYYWLKPSPSK